MRLPLIAFLVIVSGGPLAAQRGRGPDTDPAPKPVPSARPRVDPYPGPNPYYNPRYRPLNPRLSMDSVTSIVEAKYEGWHVDSKELTRERGRPVYVLGVIAGGEIGTRLIKVDGDEGYILNPEIMGDTTSTGREHHPSRYRPAPATPHP